MADSLRQAVSDAIFAMVKAGRLSFVDAGGTDTATAVVDKRLAALEKARAVKAAKRAAKAEEPAEKPAVTAKRKAKPAATAKRKAAEVVGVECGGGEFRAGSPTRSGNKYVNVFIDGQYAGAIRVDNPKLLRRALSVFRSRDAEAAIALVSE